MSEKRIEHQIRNYLNSLGAWHIKTHGNMFSKAGTPDLIGSLRGRFIAIEVKQPGGVVSPLQEAHIKLIRQAGGIAFVAYSLEDVKRELKRVGLFK